jgi:hypothetical protein
VPPDASGARVQFEERLQAVGTRVLAKHVLHAIACGAGLLIAGGIAAQLTSASPRALWPQIVIAALATFGFVVAGRPQRRAVRVAQVIELALPGSRNVVVTAQELATYPERASAWIRDRVFNDAAAQLNGTSLAAIVPLRRAVAIAAALVIAAGVVVTLPRDALRHAAAQMESARHPRADGISVQIELTPPTYSGLQVQLVDATPSGAQLEALEHTRARVSVTGIGTGWRIRFGARDLAVRLNGSRGTAETELTENGYFAIDPPETVNRPAKLIRVSVAPDRAPSVRIERPARDLILPDNRASVTVGAVASDDLALSSIALRYTRVSGTGEQFQFVEGEIPIAVSRDDEKSWRARGEIPISRLGFEPGDSLVYRVTARDRRPGSTGEASSDTYFIEIARPGEVPLEGVEMPPEQERYALSQQMIVVKIQRLREKEAGLSRQALQEGVTAIATEQKAVRANFIFLMGGQVEDEEVEAEQSGEIQEGRLENTARRDITRAISFMSRTEQDLLASDTATALAQAKLAVDALQRAFGKNRYILRSLPVRSRIDPSRRLSGALGDAKGEDRAVTPPSGDPGAAAARALLMDVLALASDLADSRRASVSATLTRAAETAIGNAGSDARWQSIGDDCIRLRDLVANDGSHADREQQLAKLVAALVARAKDGAVEAPPARHLSNRVRSAWAAEDRR